MCNFRLRLAVVSLLASTCGCASILSGRHQTVTINSAPPGARCELIREGRVIGIVEKTPGAVMVQKTKHDIDVACKMEGFLEAKNFAESGTEGTTVGNVILGGFVGWAIDSAVGADNKYPEVVTVNLSPISAVPESQRANVILTSAPQSGTPKPEAEEVARKLQALTVLKDSGLITASEYEAKRREIIDSL